MVCALSREFNKFLNHKTIINNPLCFEVGETNIFRTSASSLRQINTKNAIMVR